MDQDYINGSEYINGSQYIIWSQYIMIVNIEYLIMLLINNTDLYNNIFLQNFVNYYYIMLLSYYVISNIILI
jgi:hypothetical protein